MNKIVNQLIFSVLLGILITSCQSNNEKKKVGIVSSEPMTKEAASNPPVQMAGKEHPGMAVFKQYCLVCHQADGSGVPGMYPPLGPGSWVGKDPKELVPILLTGLSVKVEVNGESYKTAMPAQTQLTDQEIADVLSYVRSNFGNSFTAVDVELVKKIRSSK
jgi:mono/diheme cytochrome c family protein